jgi:aspartate/methionine/tyrosine aminotransferase
MNVMSKAYGLPGLRVGWLACRDRALLERIERAKHYTSICNAGPSELLATIALRHRDVVLARNRSIVAANLAELNARFARHADLIQWTEGQGGCVAFPRYLGTDGVEAFCDTLIADRQAVLLPASIYRSSLLDIPNDRFRIGFGRANPNRGWDQLEAHLDARGKYART